MIFTKSETKIEPDLRLLNHGTIQSRKKFIVQILWKREIVIFYLVSSVNGRKPKGFEEHDCFKVELLTKTGSLPNRDHK